MRCPDWLWRRLLNRYWPPEFLDPSVGRGIERLVRDGAGRAAGDEAPVFILSAGWRTGSTLLQRLINSDPGAMIWGESYEYSFVFHHLCKSLNVFDGDRLLVTLPPEALPPAEVASLLTAGWVANLSPPVSDLAGAHRAFLEGLLKGPAGRLGRTRWGVKLVRADATVARYLRWLYPRARLVYLVRNPYDTYRSYANIPGGGLYLYFPRYVVTGAVPFAVHWRHCAGSFLESAEGVGAFLVRYEDLRERRRLDELQEYLGMRLDPATLDVHVDFPHVKTREPSPSDRAVIGFVAGDLLARLGYE